MKPLADLQMSLIPDTAELPAVLDCFPRFRYMGSKFRLLPWLHVTFQDIDFETVTDAFSGSGVVSYLLKAMGKQVRANDSLAFPSVLTAATVAVFQVLLRQKAFGTGFDKLARNRGIGVMKFALTSRRHRRTSSTPQSAGNPESDFAPSADWPANCDNAIVRY